MFTAQEIAKKKLVDVQKLVADDEGGKLGKAIHDLSTVLNAKPFEGIVPSDPADLKELKLDDTVIGLLLNHVFGETDLVIGLNARKLMVALDLYDWEDSGAEERVEVKMVKVPSNYVKASLLTWLPAGEKRHFQELMEPLATAIGDYRNGFWGSLMRTLRRNFSPKDKDSLENMAEKVHQFHKATRTSTAKKILLCC